MTTIINRLTRCTAGALVAAGLAIGGSLGMAAIGNATPGDSTHQDVRSTTRIEGRGPISDGKHLTDSALKKARELPRQRFTINSPAIID